ncbi:hypothetical protein ACWWJF_11645 [Symbiopectobacterium sp. Eva_TO]
MPEVISIFYQNGHSKTARFPIIQQGPFLSMMAIIPAGRLPGYLPGELPADNLDKEPTK